MHLREHRSGRRERRGLAVLAFGALLAQMGCEPEAPGGPPPSPPDLQIVSAGDAPRQLLRYRVPAGATQKLEVEIDVDLKAGEMGGPMPTLVIAMTVSVIAVWPSGHMPLRATIDEVSARENPASSVPPVALSGPMEALEGLAIDAVLSPTGRLIGARIDPGAKQLPAALEGPMSSLVTSFEQTMMPLPDDPVGAGAVWRNSRRLTETGMQLTSVNSVAVTAIEGTTLTYALDTAIHGDDQTVVQGDLAVDIKDIVGSGAGKGTIDLATLAVTSETVAELRSVMTARGEDTPTPMTLTTQTRVRPASAPPAQVPDAAAPPQGAQSAP